MTVEQLMRELQKHDKKESVLVKFVVPDNCSGCVERVDVREVYKEPEGRPLANVIILECDQRE